MALCRNARVFPRKRGGIFRLLLRLLPARSLCAPAEICSSKGQRDQRTHRANAPFRHQKPDDARRRDLSSPPCPAIYGIGDPTEYQQMVLSVKEGDTIEQRDIIATLVSMQVRTRRFGL